ncbi:T9SS type A sorting domain-containing protein [bacterium]|nr:T9SS type A sorting domain-containing protein [bacterium]
MKVLRFLPLALLLGFSAQAQYPYVSITNLNFVSPADLAMCNDTTPYLGDTIRTRGVVITDGGLTEVASGSVQGGLRPFIFVVDTANGGAMSPFASIEVMGVVQDANGNLIPHPSFVYVAPGDIVDIVGFVGEFNGNNQLSLLDGNSFNIVGTVNSPVPATILLADLNDANGINQLPTGEQWANAYGKIENVTVSEVIYFAGGTRVSFNIVDANGNRMNVSDRFGAQKLPAHQILNPNSPYSVAAGGTGFGAFVPPVPGTFYNSISGAIRHDANGCTGDAGRGYEINPFLDSHYDLGFAPPFISNVQRDPLVPTSNQMADITLNVTDFDGSVDSVAIAWSSNAALSPSQFPKFAMTPVPGTTDEFSFSIPNQPDGSLVRYYIYAEDNDNNPSFFPSKPLNQVEPNVLYYTVRNDGMKIRDIQYSLASDYASPYVGEIVTVKGYATSSTKPYDLGYVYIQDPQETEWGGIALRGTNALSDVYRGEEVQVTGEVVEYFNFTMIDVLSVTRTGNVMEVQPVPIDPSDSAAYATRAIEKYEGMLVSAENPGGGPIWIAQTNLGFGDYAVSTDPNAPLSRSLRVHAGRQSGTAFSSLYVSIVTDTIYANLDGEMEVPAIACSDTMNMDAVVGVLNFGFSNYRIQPRNNDDFIGLNVPLDTTALPQSPFLGLEPHEALSGVAVYPNPSNGVVRIASEPARALEFALFDLHGRVLRSGSVRENGPLLDVNGLPEGVYALRLVEPSTGRAAHVKLVHRR